jgi:S-adenosylmethionine synthetase
MLITSESVKTGHPDSVADFIAAGIIVEILEEEGKIGLNIDNMPHCGIEVFLGKDICLVGGEVSSRVGVDIEKCVRQIILSMGYNDSALGLDGNYIKIINTIIPQSSDINIGTRSDLGKYKEIGAGDQGIIYGFACNETPELLPIPFVLVNGMMRVFENCRNPMFAPDGKGQVTVEYDSQGVAKRVAKILMSNAIDYRYVKKESKEMIEQEAKRMAMDYLRSWVDDETEFFFNPTGEWRAVNSCSAADSGITGRKLVVQFYGGHPGAQVGGGSVVNKSPEKVDCSAAFGARYAAKNIVAAGLAAKCSLQLSYAIGIAKPFSIYVNTFGTGTISDERLSSVIGRVFDLTPRGMIERFDLLNADLYRKLPKTLFMDDYIWEKTDMVEKLMQVVKS